MIYLDNAATTKMYDELADIYKEFYCENFFNPSAVYKKALNVAIVLRQAKKELANFFGADTGEIIITGSSTEANNLALRGTLRSNSSIVISEGEHPSVYNTAMALKNCGTNCEIIPLQKNGQIDAQKLINYIENNKVSFVSMIHISNETGAINDIKTITSNIKKINPNIIVHSDGVQAFGKISVKNLGVDLYSISAHKIKGPKGIGALYIKKGIKLNPIIYGGGQEQGLRSGTENVANIIAFSKAAKMFYEKYDINTISRYKSTFLEILHNNIDDIIDVSSDNDRTSPHIVSLIIPKIKGETLLHMLEAEDIIIGLGAACSANNKGNRVLKSMGFSSAVIENSIRVSFSMDNTPDDIIISANTIVNLVKNLRK